MTFTPLSAPIDFIILKGQRSPGTAELSGGSANNMWDERKGFALSGARLRYRGRGLARFSVVLTLISAQDWEEWHRWRPLVQQPPIGERARAMEIYHPILEDLGVSSCVVDKLHQPVQPRAGEWQIKIDFIEQRPPAPAFVEVEGSEEEPRQLSALEVEIQAERLEMNAEEFDQRSLEARLAQLQEQLEERTE